MNIPDFEQFANLVDSLQNVEPWLGPNDNIDDDATLKNIPLKRITPMTKSLGISMALPTTLPSLSSSSPTPTDWTVLAENAEYPMAQLRVAPSAAPPERALSVAVILDDGFPICCLSAEDALTKKKMMAQQEAAASGGGVVFDEEKTKVISNTEAIGQWVMTSGAGGFPPLLIREKIRVWNGMTVSISVVGPKDKVSMEDFEFVFKIVLKTVNVDHTALRLATGGMYSSLERLLVAAPAMNCMIDVPLPRRVLLNDAGAAQKSIEHHALPPLAGIPLMRMINPFTDSCLSLIALETKELTEEENVTDKPKKKTPHYIRQVISHFHANTSSPTILHEDGVLHFTAPSLNPSSSGGGGGPTRVCCAARPIPPRLGADPRMFLVLVASRLFQGPADQQVIKNILVPQLVNLVSPQNVFISSVPTSTIGESSAKGIVENYSEQFSLVDESNALRNGKPPACRYFIVQHKNANKEKNATEISYTDNPQLSAFQSLQQGEACEFQMPCFCAGNNNATAVVTRCLWGEMSATADGSGNSPALRSNIMHKMTNKSVDALFAEARYRAMMVDPNGKSKEQRCGSYQTLMVTPSDAGQSSIKNGFHFAKSVAGGGSCVCSLVVVMDTSAR